MGSVEPEVKTHPVQIHYRHGMAGALRTEATLRAYEVYSKVYAPQEAMIANGCRGGFSIGEIIAFLYAHSFPEKEWSARVDEAFESMRLP